ncbi:hypothetical protein [Streptomyces sp. NPDC088707]|uniref:hypothetical protein n=1 Tax=Streptomyces sp. NPDC088707 TaxID=3365871 RepID=UPI003817417E
MFPSSIPHTTPLLIDDRPTSADTFQTYRSGARPAVRAGLPVRAGVIDDVQDEDDAQGYEPEARLHQLVRHLVSDGDCRAEQTGRQARRTLGHMNPGYERQEVLTFARSVKAAEGASPIRSYRQRRSNDSLTPALAGTGTARGE